MPTIDFNTPLLDIDGKEIGKSIPCIIIDSDGKIQKKPDGKPVYTHQEVPELIVTFKDACIDSLLVDNGLKEDQKLPHYKLYKKISKGGKIEITLDEATLLNNCILKWNPPLIAGQISEVLQK